AKFSIFFHVFTNERCVNGTLRLYGLCSLADAWRSSRRMNHYDSLHDYFVMALSADVWTSLPVYLTISVSYVSMVFALWPMLGGVVAE
ncbi:11478_t:CDS:1, partial [Funneliformis mosseae]